MSQFFFTPLSFQAARNRYRDRLQEMDPIAFPDGGQSLLDENMSPEEADQALENALESRLHQGSVSGNLAFFAWAFSDGKIRLDGKTVREMILSIAESRALLERGIRNRSSGDGVRVIAGLLTAGGAGFLISAALILALAVIPGVALVRKKAGKRSPKRIGDGIPDQKRALEVLTLAECLADIYRDERN